MTKPFWTDEQVINQLNSGYRWDGPIITYTFPQNRSQIHFENGEGVNFLPLTATQQQFVKIALATWNDLIAPDIVLGPVGASDLEFGNTLMLPNPDYAHAYYPPLGSTWFSSLHTDLMTPQIGDHGFSTYIHEIGHALGLKHMGNYNGSDDDGPSSYQDSTVLSVMSYYGPQLQRGNGDVMWGNWSHQADGHPYATQTPMLNDIMAIQAMYGAAITRTDDTTYGFGSTVQGDAAILYDFNLNTHPILTLYDSGGIDTLNLSGWDTDSHVDLRPGHYSSVNGMTNNLAIAHNVIIENVITGAGNDGIYTNTANNYLDGGAGFNAAFFSGVFSNYDIDFNLSNRHYLIHDRTGADGTDTLINIQSAVFENFGGNLNDLTPQVHRFYNETSNTHFFTANNDEAYTLLQQGGFQYEGTAFDRNVTPDDNSTPVFRFYNEQNQSHFYSADLNEVNTVLQMDFMVYEGIAFNAYQEATDDTTAVHRFYNLNTNGHLYTADAGEIAHLSLTLAGSFQYEGIAFYTEWT